MEKCHKSPLLEVPEFPSTASHFSRLLGSNVDFIQEAQSNKK
jgi:hypothetical protein